MSVEGFNGCVENEDTLGEIQTLKGVDLQEGTRVHRYIVLGLIGKGGMGAVYKAYDPELDRNIALKMLTLSPKEGDNASLPHARLMREAQALAKLNHPNVVFVFDVGTYENGIYIAMEYVEGKTLREWIKQDAPTQQEMLEVLLAAGRGLKAAHQEGIVHRDFKPENLIVGNSGQVKVLDFGLARAAGFESLPVETRQSQSQTDSQSSDRFLSQPLTQIGTLIGTAAYMAPEHFLFQELDEKTDQFSYCLTLFEALYGKRPFTGDTRQALEDNVTQARIEFPQAVSIPDWIQRIVLKGLSVEKQDRYPSMIQLLEALESDPEAAKAARRKKQLWLVLILILAILPFGFWYLFFHAGALCTGAQMKLAGIWNVERKRIVAQSFAKTGLYYSNDSYERVEKRFEDYLRKWKKEYTKTCETTRVRGEQSEEVMDLKMGCLDRYLKNAQALIRVFADADKTVVAESVQAVSSLSNFSLCHDVETLRSRILPPKDLPTKIKVEELRDRLAEGEALSKTGKYQKGLKLIEIVQQEAQAVDYKPLQAEVLYWLGYLLESTGDYQKAEKIYYAAALAAGEIRDSRLVAMAMVRLVFVVGYRQARHDAALLIARDTEIMVAVAGGDEDIRAQFSYTLGALLFSKGDYQKALEALSKIVGDS